MSERFITDGLWIQDIKERGRIYLLNEQRGVNALCSLMNGMDSKTKRLEKENKELKEALIRCAFDPR
jgi:hypothetical protein